MITTKPSRGQAFHIDEFGKTSQRRLPISVSLRTMHHSLYLPVGRDEPIMSGNPGCGDGKQKG